MNPSIDDLIHTAWKRNYSVDSAMELLQFYGHLVDKETILTKWVALDETQEI